ncbi:S41 family peptidase [soil metagenome]
MTMGRGRTDLKAKALGWASASALAAVLALTAAPGMAAPVVAAPSLAEPALSPDGTEIAFASGGDIWTVPAQGGVARLLITDPANDSRPIYSPDGATLAFMSNRAGSTNIYLLTLATGAVRRLTFADTAEQLDGWSRDGKWIYFSSGVNDVGRQSDVFRVAAAGGTPLEVSAERYLPEFQSAPSPDGKSLAMMARGLSNGQWWRNGHSHIDETELWVKPVAQQGGGFRKLLSGGAKHAFPMWSPDGASIAYMSDETGAENLWRTPVSGGAPTQLTRFTDGRVLWPSIAYDGKSILFERGFGVWRWDAATGKAAPVPITLRGTPASEGERHLTETSFREIALSPDGRKVAVVAHGEVFAAPSKDGGPGQRISRTPGTESDLAWSPDSRRLVFVSEDGLDTHLQSYDFATSKTVALTAGAGHAQSPAFSPDGKSLAYVSGDRELKLATLSPGGTVVSERVLFKGAVEGRGATPAWSPDGKWIAFGVTGQKSFRNLYVVEASGGEARPITFLANGFTGGKIAWSPDGTFIVVDTAQRSEEGKLIRIDLLPHVPKYREDAFQDLVKAPEQPDKPSTRTPSPGRTPARPSDAPAETAKPQRTADAESKVKTEADEEAVLKAPKGGAKPVRIVFEGIRERATILPLGMGADGPVISPDGKTLVFSARQGERANLFSYSLDELSREPPSPVQITSTAAPKGDYAFAPDSKTLFYREGGKVVSSPLDTPKPKPIAITAEMDVDFAVEKSIVFDEAWNTLNRRFFDAKFNGKDWAAMRARFAPQIEGAHTGDELRRLINLMIGELDASHSGISKPADPALAASVAHVGDLGLRFDRAAFEAGKSLVIREIVTLGPVDTAGGVKVGDRLTAVDGEAIRPDSNLDRLLMGKVGRRTVLSISDATGHGRDVAVRPVTVQVAAGLIYRQWVNDRRAYVEKISGGKLGYVHIADMSDQSLAQLYVDLDAQNQNRQGVVIDVRNNNGGYVNGYALDVFTRRNYLTMTTRDLFPVPSRAALGQRALGLPTVLVTNESSLSDAEDCTEGDRSRGLGKVVGQPTAGWIIFTGSQSLIDGSAVRVPGTRIQDLRGQDMEGHPRPVDVSVDRPLGETETGKDAQLEAAVKVLLGG